MVPRHPLFIRINHWLHALAMLIAIPAGFYIHYPSPFFLMPGMAAAHVLLDCAIIVLAATWISRVVYAVYSGHWREVLFTPADLVKLPGLIAYYLFLTRTHPYYGKYNPGQKLLYTLWDILLIPLGISGLLLESPAVLADFRFVPPLLKLTAIRTAHYYLSLFYAVTLILHTYLALTENPEIMRSMFVGYVRVRPGSAGTGADGSAPVAQPLDRPAVLRALNEFLALERQQVAMYGAQAARLRSGEISSGLTRLREVEEGHVANLTALIEQYGGTVGALPALAPAAGRLLAQATRAAGLLNLLKIDAAIERKATNDYQMLLDRVSDPALRRVLRSNQVDEEQHIYWLENAVRALLAGTSPPTPERRRARVTKADPRSG